MDIREIVAPNLEQQEKIRTTFKNIAYYLLIGVISLIVMFLVPLFSGCLAGDFSLYFPETVEGWIVYIVLKVASAGSNVAIFVLFKAQAKINVKDNENYIRANELLCKVQEKKHIFVPRSPAQFNTKEYLVKGAFVFVSTLLASVTITALVLSFDLITLISSIISTLIALITGIVTMLKNEVYWTEEYLQYAEWVYKQVSEQSEGGE